jgi:predicted RNA-binding Zn-ribbon protein involved in translation (DUF1610 family)
MTRNDGGDTKEPELPSLDSLLNIGLSPLPPNSFNEMTREGLGKLVHRIRGRAGASNPHKTSALPESSDLDPDVQILSVRDVKKKQQRAMVVQHIPAATSDISSKVTLTRKRSANSNYRCPRCGAQVPAPSKRQRRYMNTQQKRAFCEAHRHKDELKAARPEWARRGYSHIGWRRLMPASASSFLRFAASWMERSHRSISHN